MAPVPASTYAPVAALPVGAPLRLAWWQDGVLHVHGATYRTTRPQIVERGPTVTWVVSGRHGPTRLLVARPSGPRLLASGDGELLLPTLSADGHYLAWPTPTGRQHLRLTEWDAIADRWVGTVVLHEPVYNGMGGPGVTLLGIDAAGSVMLGDKSDVTRVWTPGHPVVTVDRPGQMAYGGPWPGGATFIDDDSAAHLTGTFGTISAAGRFHRVGQVADWIGTWSPGGREYACDDHVRRPDGSIVTFDVDGARGVVVLGWEDDHDLVLATGGGTGVLLRCHPRTGTCVRIPGGPDLAGGDTAVGTPGG